MIFLLVFGALLPLPSAAATDSLKATYRALRAVDLDGRQSTVEGLVIARDAFRLELDGVVHFLAPVDGVTPGAVFIGEGELSLSPATAVERHHLAVRTGEKGSLEDRFDKALLLFTENADIELLTAQASTAAAQSPDPAASQVARELMDHAATQGTDIALRLLRHRANNEGHDKGALYALLDAQTLQRAIMSVDPMGTLDGETACLLVTEGKDPGYWYSHGGSGVSAVVDVEHYAIKAAVARGTELEAEAEVEISVLAPAVRTVPFDLLPSLEIRDVQLLEATPMAVEVVHSKGGSALLLPKTFAAGETIRVRIRYAGSGVIEDDGADIYTIKARSNWYPNFGFFHDRATYELTFSVPKDLMVVAVGREVESRIEEGRLVSVWRTERPITVAGFNYGDFETFEQREENTGTALKVYASKGTPDVITEINEYIKQNTSTGGTDPRLLAGIASGGGTTYVDMYSGPSSVGVSTEAMADSALVDATNAVQVLTSLFGPPHEKRLAMTQQSQWGFGQAWPSLVFLPYLTGLSKMLQIDLGLDGYAGFYDEVGIHEIAHQWWGHTVGWQSYRDQWLSEGFAEFSTAMVIELTKGNVAHRSFWNRRRAAILGRPASGGTAAIRAGSLTLGFRASTAKIPHAYSSLAYSKGAYILHMLRMLMRDHKSPGPDARFNAMMKDFVDTHRDRNASTEDFKRTVEKHIVPELNATRNGKVDWFFDQWVYGTEVPSYAVDVKTEKAGKGKFRLTGTIAQKNVSKDFLTIVGLYVDYGNGQIAQFGKMPFRGSMSRDLDLTLDLPKKPKRVVVNGEHEVLAFDG